MQPPIPLEADRRATTAPPAPPSLLTHRFVVAVALAALCVLATSAWRDAPLLQRATPLLAVAFMFTSLGLGGFWASLITFVPGILAAAYFLMEPVGSFAIADPLERARILVTILVSTAVAGMISALRVDRNRLLARDREHRESQERYRTLLDQASDAIFVSNESSRLIDVNQYACEMLGYSRDELLGRDVRELITRESLEKIPFRVRELLERPRELVEREMIRKDGSRLFVEVSARLMTDGRTQAIARDVTERRKSEDALRRLEGRLQHSQRLEAVGRLAGGVAHDFNNVLTVVLGNAQTLAATMPAGPAIDRLRDIVAAGERAASLTQQLLAFSRKQAMQFRNVDLNAVVKDFERIVRRLLDPSVTLRLDLDPGVGVVRADVVQLEQVVLNLVVNARDGLPRGGTIEILTRRESLTAPDDRGANEGACDYAVLTVKDDGIGMDAETQSRIFEPFFTTKPSGSGTGLGLSTVYGIVRQSRGFVRVRSAPGQGSCFDVCLPALEAGTRPDPHPESAPATSIEATVLLVEDEIEVRRVVRRLLEQLGLSVMDVASAQDAFRLAASMAHPPALLVTDVVMPGLGGRELADALVARWPGLRVLYLSGYVERELDLDDGLSAGRAFLAKPFTSEQLSCAIQRLLAPDPARAG